MTTRRLVYTFTDDKQADQIVTAFQMRAIVLYDMRKERHNHTVRYRELAYQLAELDHDIADLLESVGGRWEGG